MKKIRVSIFTINPNEYNSQILRVLLDSEEVELSYVFFSKPLNGEKGISNKLKRLLSFGGFNLIKIFIQKIRVEKKPIIPIKEFKYLRVNSFQEMLEKINQQNTDVVLLLNFNKIIPQKFLSKFPNTFNIHPGKLPEVRGVMPVFWTLKEKIKEGTITIHQVERGIDTGCVLKEVSVKINERSYHSLMLQLMNELSFIIIEVLKMAISDDTKKLKKQDET